MRITYLQNIRCKRFIFGYYLLNVSTTALSSNEQLSLFRSNSRPKNGQNPYLTYLNSFTQEKLLTPKFKLISLFCGGGGLDLGLGFAGFGSVVVSDLIPSFVDTVTHNIPHAKGLAEDALKLTGGQLLKLSGTKQIDL